MKRELRKTGFLDFVHRLYFNKITTFRKLDFLPSPGEKNRGPNSKGFCPSFFAWSRKKIRLIRHPVLLVPTQVPDLKPIHTFPIRVRAVCALPRQDLHFSGPCQCSYCLLLTQHFLLGVVCLYGMIMTAFPLEQLAAVALLLDDQDKPRVRSGPHSRLFIAAGL
jgi:hypothetical protein